MHLLSAIFLLRYLHVCALERSSPSQVAVTPHVLTLETLPFRYPLTPSSHHLNKRNGTLDARKDGEPPISEIQEDLLTLGGRIYMTNVTLASRPYTLVIDTGSSDTWVASSTFRCYSRVRRQLPQSACGFGTLYDDEDSSTYTKIEEYGFAVAYADGEFLNGEMGVEVLEIGGLAVRQVIGVVEAGWWMGDRVSSGLLGLAYSGLASNVKDLNYTSAMFSLYNSADETARRRRFESRRVLPIFSLALSRPTLNSKAGGLLAIGGIPDIEHENDFVSVSILPIVSTTFAFYSISVNGFMILSPDLAPSPSPTLLPSQNTTSITGYIANPVNMVVDSGTTMNYFPDFVADYIASSFEPPAVYVPTSGVYMVDCGAAVPKVAVKIAGRMFWVDERDLVPGKEGMEGVGRCIVATQRMGNRDAVLGDTFLKNVVAVFDLGVNEMRFSARGFY